MWWPSGGGIPQVCVVMMVFIVGCVSLVFDKVDCLLGRTLLLALFSSNSPTLHNFQSVHTDHLLSFWAASHNVKLVRQEAAHQKV